MITNRRVDSKVWKLDLQLEFSRVPASYCVGKTSMYTNACIINVQNKQDHNHSQSSHSLLDPVEGIHNSRLGKALLHIPKREYHQHMTRAPLTLGHLARCLPLQPLHTVNACVYVHMCHRQQPLTCSAGLGLREIPERKGVGKARFGGKKGGRQKGRWGHQNMPVSGSYATNVMRWLMWRGFCPRGHHLLFNLSSLSTSPSFSFTNNQGPSLYISKKSTWCYSTFSSAQVCAEARSLDRVTIEWNTLCKIYTENTHQPHTNPCPAWATAQQEWVCVSACIRTRMFPFPLCLKHMDWVGISQKGGVKAVIWEGVSHSTDQYMVNTLHRTLDPAHSEETQREEISLSITGLKRGVL